MLHDAPKGGAVTENLKKVFGKEKSPAWDAALKNPKKVFGKWLREVGKIANVIDIQRPSLQGESLQAVVVLREGSRDQCLKASGQDGIFVRTFVSREQADSLPQEFRTVPVPCSQDLQSALRTANSLKGPCGFVPYGKGIGIRVAIADFEETLAVVQLIREAVKFVGERYQVSGIPLSWSSEDLAQFFSGKWEMTPVFSKRVGFMKTWTVQARAVPTHSHWQHEVGLATIHKSVAASNGRRQERLVWNGPKPGEAQERPQQQQQQHQQAKKIWGPRKESLAKPPQDHQHQQHQRQHQGVMQQQHQHQHRQLPDSSSGVSPAVLAAIQAAVSAAVLPLQREVER
jgi:hypothetical protein